MAGDMATRAIIRAAHAAGACQAALGWLAERASQPIDETIAALRPDWARWALQHLPSTLTSGHRAALLGRVLIDLKTTIELLYNPRAAAPLAEHEEAALLTSVCRNPESGRPPIELALWALQHLRLTAAGRATMLARVQQYPYAAHRLLSEPGAANKLSAAKKAALVAAVCRSPAAARATLSYPGAAAKLARTHRATLLAAVQQCPFASRTLLAMPGDAAPLAEHEEAALLASICRNPQAACDAIIFNFNTLNKTQRSTLLEAVRRDPKWVEDLLAYPGRANLSAEERSILMAAKEECR